MTQPSGVVAFLFSDVEASTRRWERYGEAMRDALRRHDRILRCEIEARRGHIFKTIGDAFCAAFPSVGEALEGAVEAQRRLAREDFSAVDGLSVRMAIHVGETDERDGDYFGPAVNRASRLLSAGHGGQILVSGDAADLALPTLPVGITLRHLGALPLKDITEPERVYQPVGEGLRAEFKPLRALETPPNNLPRQTTSFVGRHDDIARVEALLDEGPLVTLVGAGGIGKTRLALEVAASRLNEERDGIWFIDLASVGDPALVAGTILSSLGGERSPDPDPIADLVSYLAKRDLLLLLDNSEHLVCEVAGIVARIIARCMQISVLVTSRSPLDISGERVYRLSSLDQASAVQLFGDRARAANPAFVVETKASVIEAICNRLDGIALAIELAAARVRSMSVENLASHLELRLLTGGRDRRPRQQTMRALIDWSYDLLTDDERAVLRRASVFARGFTLEAGATVCCSEGDDRRVLDLLTSLADKSLVVVDIGESEQRYRLLEPIREYAYEKLSEAAELPETMHRHATAMGTIARNAYEEWDRGPAADWLTRLEMELANFRAGLRWTLDGANDRDLAAQIVADTTVVILRLGLLDEGIEYCMRVLQAGLALPPAVEARLRYGLSMLYSNAGDDRKCLEEAKLAAALYREAGDRRGLARALSQVASRYLWHSRADDATVAANEALQLARESGDKRLLADVLRRCAMTFGSEGPQRVRTMFTESVALFHSLGRGDDTARALHWWAQWEIGAGNYGEAVEHLLEATRLIERDDMMMLFAGDLANCHLATGDRIRGETYARRALALAAKMRHAICTAIGVAQLAVVASERDPHKAARLVGYVEERFHAIGYEPSSPEDQFLSDLRERLSRGIGESEFARLLTEGTAWTDDQAVAHALSA